MAQNLEKRGTSLGFAEIANLQRGFPSRNRVSRYSFWARMYDVAIVKR